ncbi:hypothetical protein ACFSL6_23815 [Paenibacillus thailandensis]|uniref:Uncharacterized protein n=1 Tax=Paenibacillus thailandensis TaxID=393250 RepID=A0ABW5R282_9BACL
MRKQWEEKIDTLRSMETYGYQVAYYVLQDQRLAAEATKAALSALYRDDSFFSACLELRRKKLRSHIRTAALAVLLNRRGSRVEAAYSGQTDNVS